MRGGVTSVIGSRYIELDESKKISYVDVNNLFGHTMSQVLPYDEIEMWPSHPDLCLKKTDESLNTL